LVKKIHFLRRRLSNYITLHTHRQDHMYLTRIFS